MLVDIGVNLSSPQFQDIEGVLNRATDVGIAKLILTGTSVEETTAVIELCHRYNKQFPNMLYATAGIHPHEAKTFNTGSIKELKTLSSDPCVVAIGEAGLDFHRNISTPEQQTLAFEQQIELAIDCGKPLFLHDRDASKRQLEIIRFYIDHISAAVIHCFTGDKKTLFNYLDLDLFIGITGWICDERRGTGLQKIVHNIPLDRLMIETDSPYLLPRNLPEKPKNRVNEPAYLPYVVQSIAHHRPEDEKTITLATSANAMGFFCL